MIDGAGLDPVPTLVIVGDQDQPFLAPCEYMAKKIPGARLEVIPDAGHSSNLDQPDAFNRVLADFLKSEPPSPPPLLPPLPPLGMAAAETRPLLPPLKTPQPPPPR